MKVHSMVLGPVAGLVVVLALALLSVNLASATTHGESRLSPCPIDASPLAYAPIKTRLLPGIDRHVMRGRIEPLITCGQCGWAGVQSDLEAPHKLTPQARTSVQQWLDAQAAPVSDVARYTRAAQIAEILHPHEGGHRWLMAAQVAGHQHATYPVLRRAARDAFLKSASLRPLTGADAYAVAELSRQLGDFSLARTWFAVVVGTPDVPQRLVQYSIEALAQLGHADGPVLRR